jgi:membrane associated rhomboid family serine protease
MKKLQSKLKRDIITLFKDLKKELTWKDVVKSLIFPVIITLIFFLPNRVKNELVLKTYNPMWWQYLTGMLVHKEMVHFLCNLIGYILIFSLLLIISIKSKKKCSLFSAFLLLIIILIAARILFYGLIFKEAEMLGSSEINYGLVGLIPAFWPINMKKKLKKYLPWILGSFLFIGFYLLTLINPGEWANIPHLIGLTSGMISGFLVSKSKKIKMFLSCS